MFRKFFVCILLLVLTSCNNMDFTYKNKIDLSNPTYDKTQILITGKDIKSINKYASKYFGSNKDRIYVLNINVEEKTIKRSVNSNQAVSKVDYELFFNYELFNKKDSCLIYSTTVTSTFSYVPKSEGYNFGSDQSLQKSYDLASKNNIEEYLELISSLDLSCI